jgi:subtilisin
MSGPIAWWHRLLGVTTYEARRGRGVRIGVADTGLGAHPNLSHIHDLGAALQGRIDPHAGADCASHGTHVCGILGSRPQQAGEFGGFVPGAEIFSIRVFSKGMDTTQADIALGLDELVRHDVDLVNMSLGSTEPSRILHDALRSAFDQGTLCLCSAGNSSAAVDWPAAFKETAGVSAVGHVGWGPPQSTARACAPRNPGLYGRQDVFFASFSCFGAGITCTGPGVGIISTVPPTAAVAAPFASMDGTSLASPCACGALAAILSRLRSWRALPRNETRAHTARLALERHSRDLGLDMRHQGTGVVRI